MPPKKTRQKIEDVEQENDCEIVLPVEMRSQRGFLVIGIVIALMAAVVIYGMKTDAGMFVGSPHILGEPCSCVASSALQDSVVNDLRLRLLGAKPNEILGIHFDGSLVQLNKALGEWQHLDCLTIKELHSANDVLSVGKVIEQATSSTQCTLIIVKDGGKEFTEDVRGSWKALMESGESAGDVVVKGKALLVIQHQGSLTDILPDRVIRMLVMTLKP